MERALTLLVVQLLLAIAARGGAAPGELHVEDCFGRRIDATGLTLVDWEGYLANPALRIVLVAPQDAAFPARAVLTADEPRIFFDNPCVWNAGGASRSVEFAKAGEQSVLVTIFPDRDSKDELHALRIEFRDASGRASTLELPIRVVDQDRPDAGGFPILVDFSEDRSGFFKDEKRRSVIAQAARDWGYFFEPASLEKTPARSERTFVWNSDGFKGGRFVANAQGYIGYLLYAYGIRGSELRSGGEPSREGGFLVAQGQRLDLRRSGGLEVETQGNYNRLGWLVDLDEADGYRDTNLGDVPNDLYSIVHHEIGHALCFNPAQPRFARLKEKKTLEDARLQEYLGSAPAIDEHDHLAGTVDPASRFGVFGNEYNGEMPHCRWLITKTDLLCAAAVGYTLRPTSAFAALEIATSKLPPGSAGQAYSARLEARGGIPCYQWEIAAGELPAGMKLDSFSGVLAGTPEKPGTFEVTVRLRDPAATTKPAQRSLRIEIRK